MRGLAAFGRADFKEIFGGQDGDQQAGPVGDGVAEKRSPVRAGIGADIEDYPDRQDGGADDAERVAVQKRLSTSGHGISMTGLSSGLLESSG